MKSEKPTPQRLLKEARKGRVHHSRDLAAWLALLVGMLLITRVLSLDPLAELYLLLATHHFDIPMDEFTSLCLLAMLRIVGPIWLGCVLVTTLLSLVESRGILANEQPAFDLSKLDPVQGAKRLVSIQALKELVRSLVYLALFCGLAWWVALLVSHQALELRHASGEALGAAFLRVVERAGTWIMALSFPLMALSAVVEHALFIRGMRMDKQEIKKEYEESDGRPEIKQRRREIAAELSAQVKSDVAGSSAILANPTHYAVGILLNPEVTRIPFVSVREKGEKARAVIAYAEKMGVPVIRDVPLARRLYANCRRYQFVPLEELDPVMRLLQWLHDVERAGADLDQGAGARGGPC